MTRSMKDQGLSISEISRRLGISRTTVRRYLKSGKVPQYHRDPAGSMIEPYLPLVREMTDRHNLSAVRIYEELRKKGFQGSYSLVKQYSRPMRNDRKNLAVYRYETKLKYAGFPFRKTMEEFDFSFQKSIDRSVIDDLMTLKFMHNRENVVFLGPPGVGKTHLSVALGMRALQSDVSTYYISAVMLVQSLRKEYMRDRLNILMRSYSRYSLMIVDEIGYLPLNREESNLLFLLVSYRYEKCSTIFTSNKSF